MSTEGGSGAVREMGGDQESTEDESREEQGMAERCVLVNVSVDVH